jgi:DNA polymerase
MSRWKCPSKKHLRNFPVPESVWEEYHIDQEINDRGILVDLEMAEQAIAIDSRSRASLTEKLKKLTGLSNPNSVVQMKDWLSAHGLKTDTPWQEGCGIPSGNCSG